MRTTQAFSTGLQIPIADDFGICAELRFRFDQHQNAGTVVSAVETIGVTWHY